LLNESNEEEHEEEEEEQEQEQEQQEQQEQQDRDITTKAMQRQEDSLCSSFIRTALRVKMPRPSNGQMKTCCNRHPT